MRDKLVIEILIGRTSNFSVSVNHRSMHFGIVVPLSAPGGDTKYAVEGVAGSQLEGC